MGGDGSDGSGGGGGCAGAGYAVITGTETACTSVAGSAGGGAGSGGCGAPGAAGGGGGGASIGIVIQLASGSTQGPRLNAVRIVTASGGDGGDGGVGASGGSGGSGGLGGVTNFWCARNGGRGGDGGPGGAAGGGGGGCGGASLGVYLVPNGSALTLPLLQDSLVAGSYKVEVAQDRSRGAADGVAFRQGNPARPVSTRMPQRSSSARFEQDSSCATGSGRLLAAAAAGLGTLLAQLAARSTSDFADGFSGVACPGTRVAM